MPSQPTPILVDSSLFLILLPRPTPYNFRPSPPLPIFAKTEFSRALERLFDLTGVQPLLTSTIVVSVVDRGGAPGRRPRAQPEEDRRRPKAPVAVDSVASGRIQTENIELDPKLHSDVAVQPVLADASRSSGRPGAHIRVRCVPPHLVLFSPSLGDLSSERTLEVRAGHAVFLNSGGHRAMSLRFSDDQ
nr:uncharacterized protein LOC120962860 [Aegilops tauschii subsp. strangulata]